MTPEQAAIYARQRLGLPPSEVPRIITFIDAALFSLAAMVAESPLARDFLLTPSSTTATVSSGKIALSGVTLPVTALTLLTDKLHYGNIFYEVNSTREPIQWKDSNEFFNLADSRTEPFVHKEGDELIFKNVNNGTSVIFNVPYVPLLDTLPVRLEQEFVSQLARLAAGQ